MKTFAATLCAVVLLSAHSALACGGSYGSAQASRARIVKAHSKPATVSRLSTTPKTSTPAQPADIRAQSQLSPTSAL